MADAAATAVINYCHGAYLAFVLFCTINTYEVIIFVEHSNDADKKLHFS